MTSKNEIFSYGFQLTKRRLFCTVQTSTPLLTVYAIDSAVVNNHFNTISQYMVHDGTLPYRVIVILIENLSIRVIKVLSY